MHRSLQHTLAFLFLLSLLVAVAPSTLWAQGVTRASLTGFVTDDTGEPLPGANVVAIHEPSGTEYGTSTRNNGIYTLQNLRIGGPYTVVATFVGFQEAREEELFLSLGETQRLNIELTDEGVELEGVTVTAITDDVLNSERTGAATSVDPVEVARLPSIDRSTRDLIRTDPRNDGNLSFAGRSWLFNNLSVDGSYFNNPYGLDDPAPGGQANAEPIPFESIEQVQVSVAPYDVRQGGFTGANVNTVTKSGSNTFSGSAYTFYRDENLQGNTVSGNEVIANPDLAFNQTGFTLSGPIVEDKLFFFVNGELSRRDDPGTDFVADTDGTVAPGESRVRAGEMDDIRQRMIDVYGYDPGPYEGFIHATDNDKLLLKLDWNISSRHTLSFRYNYLDARRDLPPNPVAISFNGTGRGPNEDSLPFENAGYRINNQLNSFALEVNSRGDAWTNRFFTSYNRFRDFREPFSEPFPTLEIGQDGRTYTTLGHEPFSINNILDQDVLQVTNNFSYFAGRHVLTGGANFELFSFFNSFNLFRHGLFGFPGLPNTFSSVDDFFEQTDPSNPAELRNLITPDATPFKGEFIDVGQLAFYVQDEYAPSPRLSLTAGLRVDFPLYFTDPVDNPFSRNLTTIDENDAPITVDQSELPDVTPLWSPRVGFNWDVFGDRSTQVRGGTGIFTGRLPFVWIGNVISNPGANPNLFPGIPLDAVPADHKTQDNAILQQSFDLNAVVNDFKWPQVWTTNIGIDQQLPGGLLGTLDFIYGNDRNAIVMRNFDLGEPTRVLAQDGRPYFGAATGDNELNPDGAGVYTLDNTNEGYNLNMTAELKKDFNFGLNSSVAYSYTEAKSQIKTVEIASALWQELPVQGDPNTPNLANSEFGIRHRISGSANYRHVWGSRNRFATTVGAFFTVAEGNQFTVGGGNRYSFIYTGDVNGDGSGANDLIYIPRDASEINLADPSQWEALNAFIEQDDYLSANRGQIAERFGAVNPWFATLDVRVLQDVAFELGGAPQRLQLSLDVLNLPNLLNSNWGVRKVARASATSPLELVDFDDDGEPVFNFVGPTSTFTDDPNVLSRWRIQLGIKYLFN